MPNLISQSAAKIPLHQELIGSFSSVYVPFCWRRARTKFRLTRLRVLKMPAGAAVRSEMLRADADICGLRQLPLKRAYSMGRAKAYKGYEGKAVKEFAPVKVFEKPHRKNLVEPEPIKAKADSGTRQCWRKFLSSRSKPAHRLHATGRGY